MGNCGLKPNSKRADDVIAGQKNVHDIDALVANGIPTRMVEQRNKDAQDEEDNQDQLTNREVMEAVYLIKRKKIFLFK